MARKWKKVENGRKVFTNEHMLQAVQMILKEKKSIREVALAMNISKSVLARNVTKFKSCDNQEAIIFRTDLSCGMIFSIGEEKMLEEYILTASCMNYGLTKKQVLSLAYEFGNGLKRQLPASWIIKKCAGNDWYYGFMERHPTLSLRTPEATSVGRSTSFNKANVDSFLKNLNSLYERYRFTPDRVYNCDETGLTTAHKPPKVVAARGKKQIGQVTSAERGELVTLLFIINAIGNTIPPVFVYPRVHFKDYFLNGAPVGSVGLACRSGWMTAELFPQAMDHIIRHAKCTKENPILLILDNHASHVTIEAINKARDNGIIMLTFPPHCSHKLQPLDVSVFSSFKGRFNSACNDWLINNPGKVVSMYQIAELVGKIYQSSVMPLNITSGFKKTGIYPFNSEPFTEEDFLTSFVTDRPMSNDNDVGLCEQSSSNLSLSKVDDNTNICHSLQCTPSSSHTSALSPADIRPYPKAEPRKSGLSKNGRKKGRTRILTDSPEKREIELQTNKRKQKTTRKPQKKKKLQIDESTDEETCISVHDTSDDSIETNVNIHENIQEIDWKTDKPNIGLNDFVLVKFLTKKSVVYYVGRVESKEDDMQNFKIMYMRKNEKGNFTFPQETDCSIVDKDDIIAKLHPSTMVGGTSRAQAYFAFDLDFSHYNVR